MSDSATSSLSSMMTMRRAFVAPTGSAGCCGSAIAIGAVGKAGSERVKVLPAFSPGLATLSAPPCISARRRARANPIPSPIGPVAVARLTRANIPKMRSI